MSTGIAAKAKSKSNVVRQMCWVNHTWINPDPIFLLFAWQLLIGLSDAPTINVVNGSRTECRFEDVLREPID